VSHWDKKSGINQAFFLPVRSVPKQRDHNLFTPRGETINRYSSIIINVGAEIEVLAAVMQTLLQLVDSDRVSL
jgi:hypothetical protein